MQNRIRLTLGVSALVSAVICGHALAQTAVLTIQSDPTGAPIVVTPPDNSSQGDGVAPFDRTYAIDTPVYLTAPMTHNGKRFLKWTIDGAELPNGEGLSTPVTIAMEGNHTLTATYADVSVILTANDDVSIVGDGAAPYDGTVTARDEFCSPGGPPSRCFGLYAEENNNNRHGFVEFRADDVPATRAVLRLYQYWKENLLTAGNMGVKGTATVWGRVISFDELTKDAEGFTLTNFTSIGTFTIDDANEVGLYGLDVTAFYNANRGTNALLTFQIVFDELDPADNAIFDDRELTAHHVLGGVIPTTSAEGFPRIEIDPDLSGGGTVCHMMVDPDETQSSRAFVAEAADPAALTYTVQNNGGSGAYTVAEVTDATGNTVTDYAWLSLNKTSGGPQALLATDTVVASINTAGLQPNTYVAYLRFQQDGCDTIVRTIVLTVESRLIITPASAVYRSSTGGLAPLPVHYTLVNHSPTALNWTAAESCPWLTLSKTGGPMAVDAIDGFDAMMDPSGLSVGTHQCTITISTASSSVVQTRTVYLSVLSTESGREQWNAEFLNKAPAGDWTDVVGPADTSKWRSSCDSSLSTTILWADGGGLTPAGTDVTTQGWIWPDRTPTTAWLHNAGSRRRFGSTFPLSSNVDPVQGIVVAWRMRMGENLGAGNKSNTLIQIPGAAGPYPNGTAYGFYVNLENFVTNTDNGVGTVIGKTLTDPTKAWGSLIGQKCIIAGAAYNIDSNTATVLTLNEEPPAGVGIRYGIRPAAEPTTSSSTLSMWGLAEGGGWGPKLTDSITFTPAILGFHQWTASACVAFDVNDDSGTGTVSGTTMTDSTKSWAINQWSGKSVRIQSTSYTVTENDGTTLTLSGTPPAGSRAYVIGSGTLYAYVNLWLDGEKITPVSGIHANKIGPGGMYSFRVPAGSSGAGGAGIILGNNASFGPWDWEYDWFRVASLNVLGCPFWDGRDCVTSSICNQAWADADGDTDIDMDDFGVFQLCYSDTSTMPPDPAYCRCFDRNGDTRIDLLEFDKFRLCATQASVPWAPTAGCPE